MFRKSPRIYRWPLRPSGIMEKDSEYLTRKQTECPTSKSTGRLEPGIPIKSKSNALFKLPMWKQPLFPVVPGTSLVPTSATPKSITRMTYVDNHASSSTTLVLSLLLQPWRDRRHDVQKAIIKSDAGTAAAASRNASSNSTFPTATSYEHSVRAHHDDQAISHSQHNHRQHLETPGRLPLIQQHPSHRFPWRFEVIPPQEHSLAFSNELLLH